MKKKFPLYLACVLVPQIMIILGVIYLSKSDKNLKKTGLRISQLSLAVMIIGSFFYYLFFTPLFGLD